MDDYDLPDTHTHLKPESASYIFQPVLHRYVYNLECLARCSMIDS